jgi:DNA mismatch endonuclease, patch repair protein
MEKKLRRLLREGGFQNVSGTRSRTMGRIRAKNTKPELVVRSLIHSLGYRFRLHRSDLPGKPDIVFPSKKKVIWVHGCFWHKHGCSLGRRDLRTNRDYWRAKLTGNRVRDHKHRRTLDQLGWSYLVIWECETKKDQLRQLEKRLSTFIATRAKRQESKH